MSALANTPTLPVDNATTIDTPNAPLSTAQASLPPIPSIPSQQMRLLGHGGFGCVLSPPFTNINDTGKTVEFPGEVMKVFYRKNAANKSVRNANMLRQINNKNKPLFSFPIQKYRKTYKARNIPEYLRRKCKIASNALNANIYAVHMPDLGKSIQTIIKDPELVAKLKSVPFRNILQGFRKLLSTVDHLYKHGYVHCDVKPHNILVNPTNGDMTLIDFDLLTTISDTLDSNIVQWNSPPETIYWTNEPFINEVIHNPAFEPFTDVSEDDTRPELQSILVDIFMRTKIYDSMGLGLVDNDIDYYMQFEWIPSWIKSLGMTDTDKILLELRKLSIPTYDSFFVGYSFTTLIRTLYFDSDDNCIMPFCDKLEDIATRILEPMIRFDPRNRMTAGQAIPILDEIMSGMIGGKSRRRRKSRKVTRRRR
jgi:serine/threonine protein kinase